MVKEFMNNRAPSANEVAAKIRKRDLLTRLSVENPDLYKKYRKHVNEESNFKAIVLIVFIVSGLFSIALKTWFIVVMSLIATFYIKDQFFPGIKKANEILDELEKAIIIKKINSNTTMEQVGKMMSEKEAFHIGDRIIAHDGATIINKSVVVSVFKSFVDKDIELSNAIKVLTGYIEESKNIEAASTLSDLASELAKEAHPSRIRAYWNELVRILPDITKLTTAVAAITKLFE